MSWRDGWTKNRADLEPGATEPDLRPIVLPRPPAEAVEWAAGVIASLPRWEVLSQDRERGTLHATRTTRVWRFVDDVRLRFEPDGAGSRVLGTSRSRVGRGDFGQNARNLRELAVALRGHQDR